MLIDFDALDARLTEAVARYEKTAPTVATWANDLFVRLHENTRAVVVAEVQFADRLFLAGEWMQPNYAANDLYKLMDRLGRDTTGHAGY